MKNDVTRNPLVWGALGLCTALLMAAIYLPGISTALSMVPPGLTGWGLILGMSLIPLVIGQIVKPIRGGRPSPNLFNFWEKAGGEQWTQLYAH